MNERMATPIAKALTENPLVNSADVRARLETAEETIKGLQERIRKYDYQVQLYEKRQQEDNTYATELKEVVKELNARLMDMDEQLQAKGLELVETNQRLEEARQFLHEIVSSKAWRCVTLFRRAKQLLDIRSRDQLSNPSVKAASFSDQNAKISEKRPS
jgi:DNA repair exonuclease SbcCD ATPase subunit